MSKSLWQQVLDEIVYGKSGISTTKQNSGQKAIIKAPEHNSFLFSLVTFAHLMIKRPIYHLNL